MNAPATIESQLTRYKHSACTASSPLTSKLTRAAGPAAHVEGVAADGHEAQGADDRAAGTYSAAAVAQVSSRIPATYHVKVENTYMPAAIGSGSATQAAFRLARPARP